MKFNELPWRGRSTGLWLGAPHPTSQKKRQKEGKSDWLTPNKTSSNLPTPSVPTKPAPTPRCRPISSLHKLTPTDTITIHKVARFTNYWPAKAADATIKHKTGIKDYSLIFLDDFNAFEESHYSSSCISLSPHPPSHHCALFLGCLCSSPWGTWYL